MATTILYMLFVPLLLRATFSLLISQKVKSVQSDGAQDVELSGRALVFGLETMLRRDDNTEHVGSSLDSETFNGDVKRTKRETILGNHSCAEGMTWLVYRCVTSEKYDELKPNDVYDNEDVQLTEKTVVFDPGTNVSRGDDTEPTNSSTFDVDIKSTKNETDEVHQRCVQGMMWLKNRCVTLEMYKQITEDNNNGTRAQASQNGTAPCLQIFHLILVVLVLLAISFQ